MERGNAYLTLQRYHDFKQLKVDNPAAESAYRRALYCRFVIYAINYWKKNPDNDSMVFDVCPSEPTDDNTVMYNTPVFYEVMSVPLREEGFVCEYVQPNKWMVSLPLDTASKK